MKNLKDMPKLSSLISHAALAVAACSMVTTGQLRAQAPQAEPTPKGGQTGKMTDRPQPVNKASEIVGMEVKNQQGEKLGTIKDLVINLKMGSVAYCVLAVDPGVLEAENLHAVPLRAFRPSGDRSHLILNADKDMLTKAEGFDRNEWPSMTNPQWGAASRIWKEGQETEWSSEGAQPDETKPGESKPGESKPEKQPR